MSGGTTEGRKRIEDGRMWGGRRKSPEDYVHGTWGGYQRHIMWDELPCDECLEATRASYTPRPPRISSLLAGICNNPDCGHKITSHINTKGRCLQPCSCTMYWGPLVPKGPIRISLI